MTDAPEDPTVVALGESLIDLIGEQGASGEIAYHARPGGSPMNVAVAAARLGTPTAFLTRLSTDAFGARLTDHVAASGVDLRLAQQGPEPTSLAVVTLDAERNARYAFYREGTADVAYDPRPRPTLPRTVAMGCVTLSLLLEPARSAFRDVVAGSGRAAGSGRVVWIADPNVRPALMPDRDAFLSDVDGWARLVDVVKLSDEDLEHLGLGEAEAAQRWFAEGVRAVALTAGGDGARLHRPDRPVLVVPGRDVAVVDTVGAGDTFTAALATGLAAVGGGTDGGAELDIGTLDDASWQAVLERAVVASSITCTRAGADPPTTDELAAAS
ncbi:MAG: carbohydrate kinase [Trueperaceae bacterium]